MFAGIVTALGSLTLLAATAALMILVALALGPGRRGLRRLFGGDARPPLALAWIVATVATVGSLYLSGSGLEPCRFCWYQRIAMYPLVAVLGLALLRRDPAVWRYGLVLSIPGGLLSAYHVLLQLRPQMEVVECSATAPCTLRYFAVFGFVSIPVMAGGAFLLITALMGAVAVQTKRDTPESLSRPAPAP